MFVLYYYDSWKWSLTSMKPADQIRAMTWSVDRTSLRPLLVFAGESTKIYVFDLVLRRMVTVLIGHGGVSQGICSSCTSTSFSNCRLLTQIHYLSAYLLLEHTQTTSFNNLFHVSRQNMSIMGSNSGRSRSIPSSSMDRWTWSKTRTSIWCKASWKYARW